MLRRLETERGFGTPFLKGETVVGNGELARRKTAWALKKLRGQIPGTASPQAEYSFDATCPRQHRPHLLADLRHRKRFGQEVHIRNPDLVAQLFFGVA